MKHHNELYLLGDVARALHCPPHRIVYLLTSGQVSEPALRLGNRRIFTTEDIKRIGKKLQTLHKEIK
jgi:DNA-binding transcriptional MerR regulator